MVHCKHTDHMMHVKYTWSCHTIDHVQVCLVTYTYVASFDGKLGGGLGTRLTHMSNYRRQYCICMCTLLVYHQLDAHAGYAIHTQRYYHI